MKRIKIREYEPRRCFFCGQNGTAEPLDRHHIFESRAGFKALSEKYGLVVDLCHETCHENGVRAAHRCRKTAELLHKYGQIKWMLETGGSVEEFRMLFLRNYLSDEELEAVAAMQEAGVTDFEPDIGGYTTREGAAPADEYVDAPVELEWVC